MNNDKTQDAEVIEQGTLAIIPQQGLSTSERIAEFTKSIAQFENLQKVVRKAALGCTRNRDWRDWNGHLRPEVSAANSIAAMFGVRITDKMSEKKTTNNGYVYIVEATFEWPATGYRVEGVKGSCRSDDDIVSTRYDYDEDAGKRVKREIPATDVDEATVIKKAEANMTVNGIMTLFGLRNVSAEELKEAGIILGESQKTSFSKKAWEMSESQKNILVRFHASDAEVSGCASNADVTNLLNKLKAEKRKTKPGGSEAPAESAAPPEADQAAEIILNLQELGEVVGYEPAMISTKIGAAKKDGLAALKSLQQAWTELARAKKH